MYVEMLIHGSQQTSHVFIRKYACTRAVPYRVLVPGILCFCSTYFRQVLYYSIFFQHSHCEAYDYDNEQNTSPN